MTKTKIGSYLDYLLHLPTLVVIALAGAMLLWQLYDIAFVVGNGYVRLHTNQGTMRVYWMNGCCDVDF